jgi:[ribosomal protein S5]-alanine N-acetyltransferase
MAIDERLIFLRGKHVWLKALAVHDVEESGWVGWFNDAELCQFNQHHYFPITIETQKKFVETCVSATRLTLGVVDQANPDEICGVMSLGEIHPIHRTADLAAMLDKERTAGNPAIFLEAYTLMLRHGFEQLGLQKICAGTFRPHVGEALMKMFNFEKEGVRRRQVFKNNALRDTTLLGVFHDTVRYPTIPAHAGALQTSPA